MKLLRILPIAFVFLYAPISFAAEAKLTAGDPEIDDLFGYSVSVSGNYAIVGAYAANDSGGNSGSAYVFNLSGGTWSQQAKLLAGDAAASDEYGISVSISGDYAIIGAHKDDDGATNTGSAYINYRNQGSTDGWGQQAKFTASDAAESDEFGFSVAISGDYAIVGARSNDHSGLLDAGAAYIFEKPIGGWTDATETAKLTAGDATASDNFGVSVSISGDYAIVGAFYDDDGGDNSGSAYIFYRDNGTWTQQAKLTAGDAAASDYFGRSVAISGDYAIIGAYGNDDDGESSGSAYIFYRSGASWSQQAKLTSSNAAAGDKFGFSVSISGDYAVVGAYNDNTGTGAVYSFLRSGTSWTEKKIQTASDAATGDNFGYSVSISGDNTVVGAPNDDDTASNSGSVYIYESVADLSLPVELVSFSADVERKGAVALEWVTESEIENLGFILERRAGSTEQGEWMEIASYVTHPELQGQGSVTYRTIYSYTDNSVEIGKTYDYRLADVSYEGVKEYHSMTVSGVIVTETIPDNFTLYPAYPNPFNPSTTIEFQLPKAIQIKLTVYDIKGRAVKTLVDDWRNEGSYSVKWNGKNDNGVKLSSGVYFVIMRAKETTTSQKIFLLR